MGSLFKSKTTTTKQPFETNPWEAQQPYLQGGFDAAQSALNSGLSAQNPVTNYTASMNAGQQNAINTLSQNGMGVQGQAQTLQNAGAAGATQGLQDYAQNASGLYGQIMGQNPTQSLQGFNKSMQGVANAAGNIDQGMLGQFSNNTQDLYNTAGQDSTSRIIGNAGQYADNPYLSGQIDAAINDVRKGFDQTVGGINGAATGTGNINSTRAGILESRALDDAMDRASSISSSMRGDAYANGLNIAQAENAQQFNNQLNANSQLGQGFDRYLSSNGQAFGQLSDAAGLALSGGVAKNDMQNAQFGQGLAANDAVLNSANTSFDFLNGGYGLGQQGASDALNANTALQMQDQNVINGQLQQYLDNKTGNMDLVTAYMNAVGGNYGQSGFTTQTTQSASPFQQIVGGIATGLGAYSGMK